MMSAARLTSSDFEVPPAHPVWVAPPGGGFWTDYGRLPGKGPTFSVKEAAKIFFAMSGSWLRMRMQPDARHPAGWFTEEDGITPLQVNRVTGKDASYSFRRFTLNDIERMSWSFYRHEATAAVEFYTGMVQTGKRGEHRMKRYQEMMSEATYRLEASVNVVKWIGRLYGIVPPPVMVKTESISAWA
jgi:hypothetical protein